ncbi:MAG: YceI family protein [Roseovarius sp.]
MKAGACAALVLASGHGAGAQEGPLPAGTYRLDPSHSSLRFSVSHLGFSDYQMSFDSFDAELELDPADPGAARLRVTVDPASLDVPSPPEGFLAQLLGESWLDVVAYPEITFVSDRVRPSGENAAEVDGTLTLLGVARPVTLDVAFNGGYDAHPFEPNARVGFSAQTVFSRSDFGMSLGVPAPGSTMGVGDEVRVEIETEFTGPALAQVKE